MNTHPTTCRIAAALLAGTLLLLAAPEARAGDNIGWFGLRHKMQIDGYYGTGSRNGKDGSQFNFDFRAAMFGKHSPLGNLAGIEFATGIGWDNIPYDENDTILGDMGVPMYMQVGFPVTLFRIFGGSGDRVQVGFSPGFGISWVSAYTYLTLKGAARLSSTIAVDAVWTWYPDAASRPMGETNDAVNQATLRANVYIGAGGRRGSEFIGFVELAKGQRVNEDSTGGNSSKVLFGGQDPFGSTTRRAYEDILRFGIGYAF